MKFRVIFFIIFFTSGIHLGFGQADETILPNQVFIKVDSGLDDHEVTRNLDQTKELLREFGEITYEKVFNRTGTSVYLLRHTKGQTVMFIEQLTALDFILWSEYVPRYASFYTPNDLSPNQWSLRKINAPIAWDAARGDSNIVVAIVDDAVYIDHEDLSGVLWRNKGETPGNSTDDDGNGYVDDVYGWDAFDTDPDPRPPASARSAGQLYHGTHVAGIAGAHTDNSKGMASIGFGISLMSIKCGNDTAPYNLSTIGLLRGIEYAIVNGADVINMSWGGGAPSKTFQDIFTEAHDSGIVLVAAAGNDNQSFYLYPASYRYVISVGATDSLDKKSWFSQFNDSIDVMAPGSSIYSCLTATTGDYGFLDGTSMASPMVAGLCGLMLSKNPDLTPDEVEDILEKTCRNIDSINIPYIGSIGAGRINADSAILEVRGFIPGFVHAPRRVCPGFDVTYINRSRGIYDSIRWYFPGADTSAITDTVVVRYDSSGTFNAALTVYAGTDSVELNIPNAVTVSQPTALLSGNKTIIAGNVTRLRVEFQGNAPYSIWYTNGLVEDSLVNIKTNVIFIPVQPFKSVTYTLTGFRDAQCEGTYGGSAKIIVNRAAYNECLLRPALQDAMVWTSDDTSINPAFQLRNFGADTNLILQTTNPSGYTHVSRAFIELDLPILPRGTVVSKATLKLYNDSTATRFSGEHSTNGNNAFQIGLIEEDWFENSVTYNTQPAFDLTNSVLVPAPSDANQHFDSIDVTSLVNAIIDEPSKYFGFVLKLESELASKRIVLASSEHPDASLHPIIELCYRAPIVNVDAECIAVNLHEKYSDASGAWSPGFDTLDIFGAATANIGDIDKDGVMDLIAGSPGSDDGGTDKGALYTLRLKNDGTLKTWVKLSATANLAGITLNALDSFGYAVSGIGDLNNDFIPDVVVGAPGTDDSGTNTGAVYVLFMKATGVVDSYQKISATSGNFTGQLDSFDRFGASVTAMGDLNGDGTPDIAVGAPGDDDAQVNAGAVWILYLDTAGLVIDQQKISANLTELAGSLDANDGFGHAVKGADLNRDGRNELLVGAPDDDDGLPNSGAIYALELTPSASIIAVQKISTNEGEFNTLLPANSRFGSSIGLINFDNDAVPDLLVGVPGNRNDSNVNTGGFYVVTVRYSGIVKARSLIDLSNTTLNAELATGDRFGAAITGLGDLDGDGFDEFAVGASADDDGGTDQGAIYVLSMKDSCDNPFKGCKKIDIAQKISDTRGSFSATLQNGVQFGTSVDFIGDLDGDTIGDYVVGTPYDNTNGSRAGAIYILFMNADHTVKSYQKIAHGTGGLSSTIVSNDWFGWDVASIGDINGDTIPDIAVGAFGDGSGTVQTGAVYVLHMKRDGTVKSEFKIRDGITNFSPGMGNLDQLGCAVDVIGDLDGDGITDIIAGAQKTSDAGNETGAVYIIFMGSGSSVKGYQRISNSYGNLGYTLRPGTRFGRSVSGLGDMNEDGIPDVLVSMHGDTVGTRTTGKAGILMLDTSGKVKDLKLIEPGRNGLNYTLNSSAPVFSLALGTIPDQNNDGKVELMISAPGESVGGSGTYSGVSFAIFPDSLNDVKSYFTFNKDKTPFIGELANDDGLAFGHAGYMIGDTTVLVFGVPRDDDGGTSRGAIYVVRVYDTCVSPPPICELKPDFSNDAFCINDTIEFVDLSTDPSRLDVTFRKWDMGDGSVYVNDSIVRHKYNAPGFYVARLIVSSENGGQGCLDSIEYQIDLRDTLLYTLSQTDTICFADSLQLDLEILGCDQEPMQYLWTTNGGISNDTVRNPVISARRNTWYRVDITTGSGYEVSDSVFIVVDSSCCRSIASFDLDTNAICLTRNVNITNTTVPFGSATYEWDFGMDAEPASDTAYDPPPVRYTSYGNKTIRLIVHDQCGDDTLAKQVFAMPVPVINEYRDTSYCFGDTAWLDLTPYVNSEHYYDWQPDTPIFRLGDSLAYVVDSSKQFIIRKYSRYTGCYGIDTVTIGIRPLPVPELGADTLICSYDSLFLRPNQPGDSFMWNTGATDSGIWVNLPGKYTITVINNQCMGSDSITIDTIAPPRFNLGSDTGICPGDSLWIGVPFNPVQAYLWNRSPDDSSMIHIGDTGFFRLTITENQCSFTDSIHIDRHIAPLVDLGPDTFFCILEEIVLHPSNSNVDSFAWSDGSTDDSLLVNNAGAYSVQVFSRYCTAFDTINIIQEDSPVVDLGPDIVTCQTNVPVTIGVNDSSVYSFLWSSGDTTSRINIDTSDRLTLTVWNGKCFGSDDIRVTVDDSVIVDLGRDTAFCSPGRYVIRPVSLSHNNILWSDGTDRDSLVITTEGLYTITVWNGTCIAQDSIYIREVDIPLVDLGPDLSLCQTEAPVPAGTSAVPGYRYLWNTGDTTAMIDVYASANLTLTVWNEFCANADTLNINIDDSVIVNLGPDTSFCENDGVRLVPVEAGPGSFQWSTGSTVGSITVNAPGTYWLNVTNGECSARDSIGVREIELPVVDLGNDTFFCDDVSITLTPQLTNVDSFFWLIDGSSDPFKMIRSTGVYRVVAYNEYCTASGSVIIGQDMLPVFSLGPDTTLCEEDEFSFIAYNFESIDGQFVWDDGFTSKSRIIFEGEFALSITNQCGTVTDSVVINREICSCFLFIPNAFTPNRDGLNDRFRPIINCGVTDVHFAIYNRLGVVLYRANHFEGWDGYYKGGVALPGVYCVEIFFTDENGKRTEHFGRFQLLRRPE